MITRRSSVAVVLVSRASAVTPPTFAVESIEPTPLRSVVTTLSAAAESATTERVASTRTLPSTTFAGAAGAPGAPGAPDAPDAPDAPV